MRFEGDGLARVDGSADYVRIDVDREWLLLRSLLTSPEIGVQFMFVCHEIEALLIDHARALGEPDALIWQAETVMLEPSDSLRHDDHVHLRIACSPEEAVAGCSGGGPRWQWLPQNAPVRPLEARDWDEIAKDDPFELSERLSGRVDGSEAWLLASASDAASSCAVTACKVLAELDRSRSGTFDLAYMDPPFNAGGERGAREKKGERVAGKLAYKTPGAVWTRSWPCSSRAWLPCATR